MSDPIIDRLDQIKSRADKATEGPWGYRCGVHGNPSDGPTHHTVYSHDGAITETDYSEGGWRDAKFIAAARTDVPQTEQALRAVLDLHRRATDFYELDDFCAGCSLFHWTVQWPCPTVQAIADALGVETEGEAK